MQHFPFIRICDFNAGMMKIEKKLKQIRKKEQMSKQKHLKEPQTISVYWCYLLQNHVDMSTESK